MSWTNVPKTSIAGYTKVNTPGNQSYDESTITYDSSSTYYDSFNPNMYTNVSKPTSSVWTNVAKPI